MMSGDAANAELAEAITQLEVFKDREEIRTILDDLNALKNEEDKKKFIETGLRTKLSAILAAEEKDKASSFYDKSFYDTVDNLAMILTKYWPVNNLDDSKNPECPLTLDPITDENRLITSTGTQYSTTGEGNIIDLYNKHAKDGTLSDPTKGQGELFNARDFARIKAMVTSKEEKLEVQEPPPLLVVASSTPIPKTAASPLFAAFVGGEIMGGIGIGISIVLGTLLSPTIPFFAAIVVAPTLLGVVGGAIAGYFYTLYENNKQANVAPAPALQAGINQSSVGGQRGIMTGLRMSQRPSHVASPGNDVRGVGEHKDIFHPVGGSLTIVVSSEHRAESKRGRTRSGSR